MRRAAASGSDDRRGSTVPREGMIFDPFSGNQDGTGRSVFSSGGQRTPFLRLA